MTPKNVAKYADDVFKGKIDLDDIVPEEARVVEEYIRTRFQKILNAKAPNSIPTSEGGTAEKNEEFKEGVKEPREISPEKKEALLSALKKRFDKYPQLHEGVEWGRVEKTLKAKPDALWSIQKLEDDGGSPTIYTMESSRKYDGQPDPFNENKEGFYIGECFDENLPKRPRVAYDQSAEKFLSHKYPDLKRKGNAKDMAEELGFKLMEERGLRHVVGIMRLFLKDSTWIETPDYVRAGSADHVRSGFDYFANYATYGEGGLVQRAKVYDRDEAFKTPRFQLQVYWEEGSQSQRAS